SYLGTSNTDKSARGFMGRIHKTLLKNWILEFAPEPIGLTQLWTIPSYDERDPVKLSDNLVYTKHTN
ncbi:hypothetical protein, partial [Vibrio anguillarum]|uniref:hypothetical protein n=1 Tax=Vibrio anguillarum TaxID=55601 RepID=UPI001C043492